MGVVMEYQTMNPSVHGTSKCASSKTSGKYDTDTDTILISTLMRIWIAQLKALSKQGAYHLTMPWLQMTTVKLPHNHK